jgi:hypothetical protein
MVVAGVAKFLLRVSLESLIRFFRKKKKQGGEFKRG